ncbi:MAG: ABC transporter permease [Gammaproteobacteria bacterium]|nr:ABC transporter permease [Gammaproteobacteria bacterium]
MIPRLTTLDRKRWRLVGLLSPITLFLGVFFLAPLSIMLVYAFLEPGLYGGVEWNYYHHNFGRILGWADGEFEEFDLVYLQIFARSFRLALTTVLGALLICFPAAFWVSRLDDRWKTLCLFLITLPFFASLVVRLFAWVIILKPSGFINQTLISMGLIERPFDMLYTEGAVILGMIYIFIPFMFLPLYASLEKLDRSLIEASSDLGASRLKTFLRVTLPLSLPGIIGGSIIVFIPSLGNFIVPDLLGGAKVLMIGNLVEQQFLQARNWPFGSALAMMIMVAVLIFLLIYVSVVTRSETMSEGREF